MLRITKDYKYYGIDNIEKIITEIKTPMGFTTVDTWGFYAENIDDKTVTNIVENFENACEEITDCTDINLLNDVIIHHTIMNPFNVGERRPTHVYYIGKYMIPERTCEEGNYLLIYIGLGEATCEISAAVWDQQFGRNRLTAKTAGDNITIEQKKMNIDEFLNLFKTIVDSNVSSGCPTSSEYHNIVYRINNSTGLEPVYNNLLGDTLIDTTLIDTTSKNIPSLKNIPIAGIDWIDWSKVNSDAITRKYWQYNNWAVDYSDWAIDLHNIIDDVNNYDADDSGYILKD